MSNQKRKQSVIDVNDFLIVQKIKEKEPAELTASCGRLEAMHCLCFKTECDCEGKLLAEEQEAITRKQLQMLQADERGKQALSAEIAALKKRQEQRAELLRNRQRALEIERERARKVASLPPPLPKSVKLLLKQTEEPTASEPDVLMPEELTASTIKPIDPNYENKENMMDPEELEAMQKMQDKRQAVANKRFNEALKKDRQKMEYSTVMKQIQNAEFINRREMAKNISSEKTNMPCPLSDKIQFSAKQADMEDAAEKMFKKHDTKEHVIEDIEGYQDHYEDKYKKMDSSYETKMIDCIPSFVKENYVYLLEDESKLNAGRRSSELDTSSDLLNEAYIETPPDADKVDERAEIESTIRHLDRFRSNFQEEYDRTLKPLLLAAMETPKKKVTDKAVETVHVVAEDKAVETDLQFKTTPPPAPVLVTPPPAPVFDYKNAGVMAFKKRTHVPLGNFQGTAVPRMHKREVLYDPPSARQSEYSTPSPLSASSYCSLPSKHGMPTFPSDSESVQCDICVAEKKKDIQNNLSEFQSKVAKASDKAAVSTEKPQLSDYIRQIAEKYLAPTSTSIHLPKERTLSEPILSDHRTGPAFENKTTKSEAELISVFQKDREASPETAASPQLNKAFYTSPETTEEVDTVPKVVETTRYSKPAERFLGKNEVTADKFEKEHLTESCLKEKNYDTVTSPDDQLSDYALEAKRIQAIHQVLSRKIPRFTLNYDTQPEDGMVLKPHIYHELSTIPELDSALAENSLQVSQRDLSGEKADKKVSSSLRISQRDLSGERPERNVSSSEKSDGDQSAKGLKVASLLDPPTSQVTDLAKSIHFVPEAEENEYSHSKSSEVVSSDHISATPVLSKDGKPLPSCTSSSDSNSLSSFSSGTKVFSSTLTGNHVNFPHLRDVKTLPDYFRNVSDIQKSASPSEKSVSDSSVPLPEYFGSTQSSSSSPSVPSVISAKLKDNEGTLHSIASGYISDLERPSVGSSNNNLVSNKDEKYSVISETVKTKEPRSFTHLKIGKGSFVSRFLNDVGAPNASETGVFGPLTPQSNISSPAVSKDSIVSRFLNDITSPYVSKTGIFHPMTPHSNISSPGVSNIYDNQASSVGSFKPLTPRSHITSPSDSSAHSFDSEKFKVHYDSSRQSFKALTPKSMISSPSFSSEEKESQGNRCVSTPKELAINVPKYKPEDSTSVISFRAITPHSHITSPSDSNVHSLDNGVFKAHSDSSGSFKTLTPKSMISSPSFSSDEKELQRNASSENSSSYPLMVRFDISASSLSSNTTHGLKEFSRINCNLSLKTHLSHLLNYKPLAQVLNLQDNSTVMDDRRVYDANKINEITEQKESSGKKTKYAVTSSSDFFVPSINEDVTNSKELSHPNLVPPAIMVEDVDNNCQSQPDSVKKLSSDCLEVFDEKQLSSKSVGMKEKDSEKEVTERKSNENPKDSCEKPSTYETEWSQNFCKPKSNLQAVSSSNSSSENLSEISCSKVTCQSTPVKSISELIQEPGILEEPSLTLVADLTSTINTTVKPKNFSTSKHPTTDKRDTTPTIASSDCRTPVTSPQASPTPETPSMISFLSHERSCMAQNDGAPSAADSASMTPGTSGNKMPHAKEVGKSPFVKMSYKARTKRLWNNLEEVKKKNSMQEKKKLLELNRQKAKEFAKKLTPKQKGK